MRNAIDERLRKWLADSLDVRKRTGAGLAKALGIDQSAVSKMLSGKRSIKARELPTIVAYVGKPLPSELMIYGSRTPVLSVKVVGVVQSGVWREGGGTMPESGIAEIFVPPTQRHRDVERFAYKVEGDSANRYALDGMYLVCVAYWDVRQQIADEDRVIVERRRGDLVEVSCKRVRLVNGRIELWSDSYTLPPEDPLVYQSTDIAEVVEIVGLVVGRYVDK